jgi:hypothetical protein
VPISQLEEHTFLQRQQILWERDDEDRRPETEMQTDLPFTFDVPLLEDADTTKGVPPLPLPPRLDIAGGGPGLQVRYTLEVKVKRSGMFNKSAKCVHNALVPAADRLVGPPSSCASETHPRRYQGN